MAAFVGDAGVIGTSGPFDGVPRERVYGISRTALGGLRPVKCLTVFGIRVETAP